MGNPASSLEGPIRAAIAVLLCASVTAGAHQPSAPALNTPRTAAGPVVRIERLVQGLAPAVDALVDATKPARWTKRRACLYYALAGQRLLAQQGIWAQIRAGSVVYGPFTVARHSIRPHFWLETPTHFIDFSTLPRWGKASIVPLTRVAYQPGQASPASTRILAFRAPCDAACQTFVAGHRQALESQLTSPFAQKPDPSEETSRSHSPQSSSPSQASISAARARR
jgi:hypothetical protein